MRRTHSTGSRTRAAPQRAGTNWLPALLLVSPSRTLISMVMRASDWRAVLDDRGSGLPRDAGDEGVVDGAAGDARRVRGSFCASRTPEDVEAAQRASASA